MVRCLASCLGFALTNSVAYEKKQRGLGCYPNSKKSLKIEVNLCWSEIHTMADAEIVTQMTWS